MRAVVLTDERPRLEVTELPNPRPAAGEALVRVTGCGICGSDLHAAAKMGAPGTVLGHEVAGVVEALGDGVGGVTVGTAVAIRPLTGCGHCRFCTAGRADHCAAFALVGMQRPGGFAEYTTAPVDALYALPASVTADEQALVEPFAVARRGLRRVDLRGGERVVVLGGGPIGLAVAHWARALGAASVILSDPLPHRRALALTLGADTAVDPEEVADVVGDGAPVVMECTGRPGLIDSAMQLAAVDGRVGVVGVCMRPDTVVPWFGLHKELDVRFSLYYGRDDFTETIDGFASGALHPDGLVTETIDLDALPERFARLATESDAGKVIVRP